jgi:hypothetical protein
MAPALQINGAERTRENMKKEILKTKSKYSAIALTLALATMAALTCGCGQQAYSEGTVGGGTTITGGGITTTTGTNGNNPLVNPIATTTTSNGSPNYSFHFQTTGSGNASQVGGGSMAISTDTVLRVSMTAGNGLPLAGTGYTVGFNCEQFNIKIGNITQTAFVKKNNYSDFMLQYGYMSYDPCAGAQTTWSYDFSGALGPGHNSLNIQINGTQIDNCRLYSDPYDGGCVMAAQYSSYASDGYIAVTTD